VFHGADYRTLKPPPDCIANLKSEIQTIVHTVGGRAGAEPREYALFT
jgi:hypothetical protein